MDNRMVHVLLTVGRLLVAVIVCVSLAVSLLLWSMGALLDREVYVSVAADDAFITALQADVRDHLEDECLFYGIPFEVMDGVVTAEQMRSTAQARMGSVYDALYSGGEPDTIVLDAAPFQAVIQAYFDSLPIEEQPLDTAAAATVAKDFAEGVSAVMQLGITAKLVKTAHPVFAEGSLPRTVLRVFPWCVVITVLFALVGMIPVKTTLRQRAYGVSGALFVGSTLVAVPTWLFVGLDFPASIALGESALREYVRLLLYTVLDRMTVITTTAFVISAILLIASIVWLVIEKKGNEVAS